MAIQASMGNGVKRPAVAGLFYPADAVQLQQDLDEYLRAADLMPDCEPRALIVPHAGYIYSGPVAAVAYRQLENIADRIRRVLLLGPAHRVGFQGVAVHSAEHFRTPLGDVLLDREAINDLRRLPFVQTLDQAFAQEHSLEVQLPFLQRFLSGFELVPVLVGQSNYGQTAEVIERLGLGSDTLVLISSDLSHYHSYSDARKMDAEASRAILELNPNDLGYDYACGRIGIGGLLSVAKSQGWRSMQLDLRNSGDTAGPRDRVVGYGAYAFV